MTKEEALALDLALEALESIQRYGLDTLSGRADGPDDRAWQREGVNEMTKRATVGITAIKQARSAPVQEPLAWKPEDYGYPKTYEPPAAQPAPAPGYCKHCKQYSIEEPLPAAHQQWVWLTDEQFQAIRSRLSRQDGWDGDGWDLALKEAIEAKLKEKNNG